MKGGLQNQQGLESQQHERQRNGQKYHMIMRKETVEDYCIPCLGLDLDTPAAICKIRDRSVVPSKRKIRLSSLLHITQVEENSDESADSIRQKGS